MTDVVVFDGDDTLWIVEPLYDDARERAAKVVAGVGLDPKRWDQLQRSIDVTSVKDLGLSAERFPNSCVEAYRRLAGATADAEVEQRVRDAAASVFTTPAPLAPDVRGVLGELTKTHRLALLTQGDPQVQERRVTDSELEKFFEVVSIVERKDQLSFEQVLAKLAVAPAQAWSIGNSLPSDINPALSIGMSAIWIDAHVWEHERRETRPSEGRLFEVASLREVPRVLATAHTAA